MTELGDLIKPIGCSVTSATDSYGNPIVIVHTCSDPNCTARA